MPDKPSARHSAFAKAVCLDLPYILDSIWRRAEFNVNRFFSYQVRPAESHGVEANLAVRPYTRIPAFWFFLATLVFVAYGPTFTAWCSVVGPAGMRDTRAVLGAACVVLAAAAWWRLIRYGEARAQKRFFKAPVLAGEIWRRLFVRAGVQIAVFATVTTI